MSLHSSVQESLHSSDDNLSFHSASYHLEDVYHSVSEPPEPQGTCLRSCFDAFLHRVGATNINLVWFIIVLSFGIVLSLSVAMKKPYDIDSSYIHYFFVVCMSIGSLWMCGAFTCRAPPCGCCIVGRNAESQIPCYMIIALTFFCIGSCFISGVDFLCFIYALNCNDTRLNKGLPVSEGLYNLSKFAFLLFQLHFFCRFSGKTFYRRCCTSFFILHIIAVNLTSWLYFIVDESVQQNSTYLSTNCTELRDIAGFVDAADIYLYPFNIEYTVMSSVLFLLLWFELKKKPKAQQSRHQESRIYGGSRCKTVKRYYSKVKGLLSKMCHCKQPYVLNADNDAKTMFFWKSAIVGYTVGIVVLTAYLVIIVLMATEYTHKDSMRSFYAVRITLFILLAFASGFGLVCLPKRGSHNKLHTRVDSILIMIGVSGCYILTFFEIMSAISDEKQCSINKALISNTTTNYTISKADDNVRFPIDLCSSFGVYFSDKAICLLQFSLQAIFIVKALRRGHEEVSMTSVLSLSIVRNVSALLSLGNFGIWAMDTFELKDITTVNDVEIAAYGEGSWHILVHIVYPLCIFFRLHSAFCFFEVVINRFGINVQPRYQRFVPNSRRYRPCVEDGPPPRHRAGSF